MPDTDANPPADDGEDKKEHYLHLEPLHLKPLPEPEPLVEPEHLHPERLHLEHVGDEDEKPDED